MSVTIVSDCLLKKKSAWNRQHIDRMKGVYIPECTATGEYKPKQCHPSTASCWCVDSTTGEEIKGTRKTRLEGEVTCDKPNGGRINVLMTEKNFSIQALQGSCSSSINKQKLAHVVPCSPFGKNLFSSQVFPDFWSKAEKSRLFASLNFQTSTKDKNFLLNFLFRLKAILTMHPVNIFCLAFFILSLILSLF